MTKIIVCLIILWCIYLNIQIFNIYDGVYGLNNAVKLLSSGLIELHGK